MSRRFWAILILAICGLAGVADAESRFAKPKFESGYKDPELLLPAARAEWLDWFDTGLLATCLLLGAWLVLKKRSRWGVRILTIFCLGYFGFGFDFGILEFVIGQWNGMIRDGTISPETLSSMGDVFGTEFGMVRYSSEMLRAGCVCPIGAIQNVTLAIFDSGYAIPVFVLAFFALPILTSLLFGRIFCSSVCPLGAIQDIVTAWPIQLPAWLVRVGGVMRWIVLAMTVWLVACGSGFYVCRYDPFIGLFRLGGPWTVIVIGVSLLVFGMVVARPYCRFICPYGAVLGLASRLSWKHATITPGKCISCKLCSGSCPFGAIDKPSEKIEDERAAGRGRLILLLAMLPVIVGAGSLVAKNAGRKVAETNREYRLFVRLQQEQSGAVDGLTDPSEAFRKNNKMPDDASISAKLDEIESRYERGGIFAGGFIGLVIAVQLVAVNIRRRRKDYTANKYSCVSCARCFKYCPVEKDTEIVEVQQ